MLLRLSSTENTVIHSICIAYTFLALAWKQLSWVYAYRHMGVKALFSSAPWQPPPPQASPSPYYTVVFHLLVIPKYLPWHHGTNIFLVLLPSEAQFSNSLVKTPRKSWMLGCEAEEINHFHGYIGVLWFYVSTGLAKLPLKEVDNL